ncbi:MAG: heme ABC exporter ATP-binding protein CcmA [Chloroflexota bacterium]|nr:heme ABC exporter ATP-binding protein CcmA [Chloroflexota bacterium]
MKSVPYLEVRGLKKSFGLKPVLRGLDLALAEGQRMAMLGANGAGKTTLLRILALLTAPGAGSVSIGGLDSARDAQQARRLVGFVAHQPYIYDELTALENLVFFARMYLVPRPQERARALLSAVGLERRAREHAGAFSRGQMQRLSLARALLHSPRLLLLDEPETGLDEEGHRLLETLLAEHTRQGGTTLFTTHQLESTLTLADQVVMLAGGRVAYQRETAKLDLSSVRQAYQEIVR